MERFFFSVIALAFAIAGAYAPLVHAGPLEQKAIRNHVKEAVRNFHPDSVPKAPIDPAQLEFAPLKPGQRGDGFGWDSDVRFGTYKGNPVAVKFFKTVSFAALHNETPLSEADFARKIKQGYFVLNEVNELGYAPKPFGYALASSGELQDLIKAAGIGSGPYYGAIVMQRISPVYHPKSQNAEEKAPFASDRVIENQVRKATASINSVGLGANDLDFMIDRDHRFYFIDFDFWKVGSSKGVWKEGLMTSENGTYPLCPKTVLDKLAKALKP